MDTYAWSIINIVQTRSTGATGRGSLEWEQMTIKPLELAKALQIVEEWLGWFLWNINLADKWQIIFSDSFHMALAI